MATTASTSATGNPFTDRDHRLVQMLLDMYDTDDIAREFGVSRRTAQSYCDDLRLRLGVAKRRHIPRAYAKVMGEWRP